MGAEAELNGHAAAPKRKRAAASKRTGAGAPAGKVSMNLSLSRDVKMRIELHALWRDVSASAIVAELAETHLREVMLRRYDAGQGAELPAAVEPVPVPPAKRATTPRS